MVGIHGNDMIMMDRMTDRGRHPQCLSVWFRCCAGACCLTGVFAICLARMVTY